MREQCGPPKDGTDEFAVHRLKGRRMILFGAPLVRYLFVPNQTALAAERTVRVALGHPGNRNTDDPVKEVRP